MLLLQDREEINYGKFITVMEKFDDHYNKMSRRNISLVTAVTQSSKNEGVAQNVRCDQWARTMFYIIINAPCKF